MGARLGVNIDHVATLRQQRGESYPSVVRAAEAALRGGADQITIHLREDRRHIQDYDLKAVQEVCQRFQRPLNLELGCDPQIVGLACELAPAWVCLVPEKREERTTEGGLALEEPHILQRVQDSIVQLRKRTTSTRISLFVEADLSIIQQSLSLHVDAVEIHTGDFAREFLHHRPIDYFLAKYQLAHQLVKAHGVGFHAGHGLTDKSVQPLVSSGLFEEFNIGHWIVSESVFFGLENVVRQLKARL